MYQIDFTKNLHNQAFYT